jgi:hypothetical protein
MISVGMTDVCVCNVPAPSEVLGNSWQAEALKIGCQDFIASIETEIAEAFHSRIARSQLAGGGRRVLGHDRALSEALFDEGAELYQELCDVRCTPVVKKGAKKKPKRRVTNQRQDTYNQEF